MPEGFALRWRLALWVALLVSVTAYVALPLRDVPLLSVGGVNVFTNDLIVFIALFPGLRELMRVAGSKDATFSRLVCRLLIAYLLYEFLVVIPFAMWLDKASLTTVIRAMGSRFYWILLPAFLPLLRDAKMRKTASNVVIGATVVLALAGLYYAATGGGGFYSDTGEDLRYRIFGALAPPLFAWPLAVGVAGVASTAASLGLGLLAVIGQTLTGFRSGIIAYAVAAVTGFLTSKRLGRVAMWAVPVGLVGVVIFLVWGSTTNAIYGYAISHLLDLGSANAVDRLTRWRLAYNFFSTHVLNDYVWTWHRYLVTLTLGYEPHNFLLEIATTEGIAGVAFYGAMIAIVARAAWKRIWVDGETRALACFFIAYLIFSSVNANWYSYSSMPLFVIAVAALAGRLDDLGSEPVEAAPVIDEPQPASPATASHGA